MAIGEPWKPFVPPPQPWFSPAGPQLPPICVPVYKVLRSDARGCSEQIRFTDKQLAMFFASEANDHFVAESFYWVEEAEGE